MDESTSNVIETFAAVAVFVAAVFGVAFWANKAQRDRSALMGLYLVLGIPGFLATLYGAVLAASGSERGLLWLGLGLGLVLPLLPHVRKWIAKYTPLDPTSAIDMTGLSLLLAAIGFLAASTWVDPNPDEVGGEIDRLALSAQFIAGTLMSFAIVGLFFWRDWRQSVARLGLTWPTGKVIGVALLVLLASFVAMVAAGILTYAFQPDIEREINRITEDITANVESPLGAVFFGVGAATSEELLFRGAIQPRYGIGLTALLFGLVHAQYGFSFILLGVFSIGILLGYQRKYFGTTSAIITHATFNAISVLIG